MNAITSTRLRTHVAGAILSALALSFATVSRADDGTAPPQVIVIRRSGHIDFTGRSGSLRPDSWRGRRGVLAHVRHRRSVQVAQERLFAKSNRRRGDKGQSPGIVRCLRIQVRRVTADGAGRGGDSLVLCGRPHATGHP